MNQIESSSTISITSSILTALINSRKKLLTETLPLFSTSSINNKSNTKSNKSNQTSSLLSSSPHTLTLLTNNNDGITIKIGPHSFLNTNLYRCDWTSEDDSVTLPTILPSPPLSTSTPIASTSTLPPLPISSTSTSTSTTSLPSTITPELIKKLNEASALDSKLADTLQKAAIGLASSEELKSLALYIDSMRIKEMEEKGEGVDSEIIVVVEEEVENEKEMEVEEVVQKKVNIVGNGKGKEVNRNGRDHDKNEIGLVIEFKENLNSKFILPSHYTYNLLPTSTTSPSSSITTIGEESVLLSFFVFPSNNNNSNNGNLEKGKGRTTTILGQQEGSIPVPISIIIENCDESIKEVLLKGSRTSRDKNDNIEHWYKKMINQIPPRIIVVQPPKLKQLSPEPISLLPLPLPFSIQSSSNSISMSRRTSSNFSKDSTPIITTTNPSFTSLPINSDTKDSLSNGKLKKLKNSKLLKSNKLQLLGKRKLNSISDIKSELSTSTSNPDLPIKPKGKPGPKRIRDRKAETARSKAHADHAAAILAGIPTEAPPAKRKRGKGKFNRVKIHPVDVVGSV